MSKKVEIQEKDENPRDRIRREYFEKIAECNKLVEGIDAEKDMLAYQRAVFNEGKCIAAVAEWQKTEIAALQKREGKPLS